MSPHCPAIFLQHSRSADVIAAPGNTHAASGSATSISARAETPSLIHSFNITSLSTGDSKTQQAGKGFSLPPSRDPGMLGERTGDSRNTGKVERDHDRRGNYVITVDARNSTETKVKTPVYYPGVRSERNATIIQLGRAEKRTHIDFGVPAEGVLEPRGHP
jgi:hypothetical protein